MGGGGIQCAVPESIHTPPHGRLLETPGGGGEDLKPKLLEGKYEANWNFLGG